MYLFDICQQRYILHKISGKALCTIAKKLNKKPFPTGTQSFLDVLCLKKEQKL